MRTSTLLVAAGLLSASTLTAQSGKPSFDRTVTPKAGADPVANIPKWTKTTLSNGATLLVVERHALPLVSFCG
jgi:hypothetical protein